MKRFLIFLVFMFINQAFADDYITIENKKIIDDCLIKVKEGKISRRYTNRPQTDLVFKKNNQINIHIQVQLRYDYDFTSEEFNKSVKLIEESKSVIIDFYKEQGLVLNLNFEHAPYNLNAMDSHPAPQERAHAVYVKKFTGDAMWSVLWGVNFEWTPEDRGKIYTHELSHLLGLADEYEGARSSTEGAADNIMVNWDAPNARFYPHQIKEIISPLCD